MTKNLLKKTFIEDTGWPYMFLDYELQIFSKCIDIRKVKMVV